MPSSDIVHRHTFSFREAIAALLPDDQVDCDSYEVRVVGSALVLDIVNPITKEKEHAVEVGVPQREESATAPDNGGDDAKVQSTTGPAPKDPPREPERLKGGPLATRAGIICGEKAFWVFMDAGSADAAAAEVRTACGVSSRAELDHDERAAEEFRRIDRDYKAWLRADAA